MCGIAGVLCSEGRSVRELDRVVGRMIKLLSHRGPDDYGIWTNEASEVGLGHRRLAILDLSIEGHQPMRSADGRYVITFNGEIYNYRSLRSELAGLGHSFRGGSDTEVMLAAFSQWGVEAALKHFVGMFAFGLWDRKDRVLYLARDRFGEKPLYYGWLNGALLFGSELKALRAYPGWQGEIDQDALTLFMRHGYIPAPRSIYQNILKLPAANYLKLSGSRPGELPEPECYWSLVRLAAAAARDPFQGSDVEARQELDRLLRESVAGQMVADVPLGAFLSGGIDSSTIVALMQAQSSRPVKTFTIGFEERSHDEAGHAAKVAKHLGTDHTELRVTSTDALALVQRLPQVYDEPFSDSSQIPTYLLSQLARHHVTVSLSGDGGDEMFGGYLHYSTALRISNILGRFPEGVRRGAAWVLAGVDVLTWDKLARGVPRRIIPAVLAERLGLRLLKLSRVLRRPNVGSVFSELETQWGCDWLLDKRATQSYTSQQLALVSLLPSAMGRMMVCDALNYLPDDILVKLDRAAMAVSLESRVPMLDHRVAEFGLRVPVGMRMRNGQGKWLLRQVLHAYVPPELVERPKMGFSIPMGQWLKGPLRAWAEPLLEEKLLLEQGLFDAKAVRNVWKCYLAGATYYGPELWSLLTFQAWLKAH